MKETANKTLCVGVKFSVCMLSRTFESRGISTVDVRMATCLSFMVRGDYCIWHFLDIYNSRHKNNDDNNNSYGNITHYHNDDSINYDVIVITVVIMKKILYVKA